MTEENPTQKKTRGRPRLDPAAHTVIITARVTPAQKKEFFARGGAQWLRALLGASK